MSTEQIAVGQIVGAWGLSGGVKVHPLTEAAHRFEAGATMEAAGRTLHVRATKRAGRHLAVEFVELTDRLQAEELRAAYLMVDRSSAAPLPEGQYYHFELVGLSVATASGRQLGSLTEVMELPANDVFKVVGNTEYLIPAIKSAVRSVDLDSGVMVVEDWIVEAEQS